MKTKRIHETTKHIRCSNEKMTSMQMNLVVKTQSHSSLLCQIIDRETKMLNRMNEMQRKLEQHYGFYEYSSNNLPEPTQTQQIVSGNLNIILEKQNSILNNLEDRIEKLEQKIIKKQQEELEFTKLYNSLLDEEDEDSDNFVSIITAYTSSDD